MRQAPGLTTIPVDRLPDIGPHEVTDPLERGDVVLFPSSPVDLPPAEDLAFLRNDLPRVISLKNISYYPEAGRVYGLKADRDIRERTTRILREHHQRVDAFLRRIITPLTDRWITGTTSFRPLQEKGRALAAHASNELIHIDSKAYGATHGSRIFRFFTNINPSEPRVWRVKGTFPDLLAEFGRHAGIAPSVPSPAYLSERLIDRLYTGFIRTVSTVVPMARSLDSSPYDRAMRRLHNFMKENADFQQSDAGSRIIEFGPMSSWMVFTDMVGHSCLSGQHMLSNTYIIPVENCRQKELTPLACFRRGVPTP